MTSIAKLRAPSVALALGLTLLCGCRDDPAAQLDTGPVIKRDAAARDSGGTRDARRPAPDTTRPDTKPALPSNVGEGCKTSADCKPGSPVCFLINKEENLRVCSKNCTPDNPATTTINEDECPTGSTCGNRQFGVGFCLKLCTPSTTKNPCPASGKLTCAPESELLTAAYRKRVVCHKPACANGNDCPVTSDKTCIVDFECRSLGTSAYCHKPDLATANNRCALPGFCSKGGMCGKHTRGKAGAKVGDPCTADLDCTDGGVCLTRLKTGSLDITHANGYCSIPNCSYSATLKEFACPKGSTCERRIFGGRCYKTCAVNDAKGCRAHVADKGGNYECNDLSRLQFTITRTEIVKAADQPVCQPPWACNRFGASAGCESMGDAKNTTKMRCRNPKTGADLTNKRDPAGACLDDTASGAFSK